MNSQKPNISIQNLSKIFPCHSRKKKGGLSTDGLSALLYIFKKISTFSRSGKTAKDKKTRYHVALNNLAFDVYPGEVLGIIGRNGAGKTTLLKILARVLSPTSGVVKIKGNVISMLELGVGFAPDLSVRENIDIQGRLACIPVKKIAAIEHKILEFAGLLEYRDTALADCPAGSFAKLGFSIMANMDVDIILADEVIAVGDSMFRKVCEEKACEVAKQGGSVLFVSHDMQAIRRMCSRVVWIDRGDIRQVGPTKQVVDSYVSELLAGRFAAENKKSGLSNTCRLLDTRLIDVQLAQVGALQIFEEGYIDCLVEVLQGGIELKVEIQLWQDRHHVLTTYLEHEIDIGTEGVFSARVKIPANFLNEVKYQVKARLYVIGASDLSQAPVLAAENTLEFTAMNLQPEQSVWRGWSGRRQGVVAPKLKWKLKTNIDTVV